jgi:hypothetical protein
MREISIKSQNSQNWLDKLRSVFNVFSHGVSIYLDVKTPSSDGGEEITEAEAVWFSLTLAAEITKNVPSMQNYHEFLVSLAEKNNPNLGEKNRVRMD